MKDVKKAYEDIKISEIEKNKIFNNIMEKRKKGFGWGPILGFGAVALASLGLFILFNKTNTPNIPNIPNNPNTPGGSILAKRNVGLENNYRKEIIVKTKKYLEANNIDIEDIKEGEELLVEADKIVDNEEYKGCKGNLVIKRYNDDFSYTTDVICNGEDTDLSDSKEYIIYSGTLTDVFELKYGIAVASISNVKKPYLDVLDCNANLIVMDNNGNIKFNKTIESPYEDEDSTVKVINVKMLNNKYYLILEIANEIHFEATGAGSLRNHYYIMTLDENGKELSFQEMLDRDNSIFVDSFVGGDAYKIYATGSLYDKVNNKTDNVIIEIADDHIETIPYQVLENGERKGVARHSVIEGYEIDAFFGYKYDKSYDESKYYAANILFKMNMESKIVWEANLEDYNIIKIKVAVNKVYVLANNGSVYKLFIYGVDGQKQKEKTLEDIYHVTDFYIEGTHTIIKGEDKSRNQFFEILDKDLNKEEKINIDNSDIEEEFEYSFMQYAKLEDKKVIAGYTVNKNFVENDEVLLVFNK